MQEGIPSPALTQSALLCHTLSPTELAQRPHWKSLRIVTACSALTYPDSAVCLLIDTLFKTKVWNTHFFSFPKACQAFHSSILTTLCEGWLTGPGTCDGRVPNSRRFTNPVSHRGWWGLRRVSRTSLFMYMDTEGLFGDWSYTKFRQDASLDSKAPTFRSKSPTILSADILAAGVRGVAP